VCSSSQISVRSPFGGLPHTVRCETREARRGAREEGSENPGSADALRGNQVRDSDPEPRISNPDSRVLRLVEFPVSTCPFHPHSAFDSWHGLERPRPWHARPGAMTRALGELLAVAKECGAYANVYFDPAAIVGLPDRDEFLRCFAKAGTPEDYARMAGRVKS
jgi:hypothetical protein